MPQPKPSKSADKRPKINSLPHKNWLLHTAPHPPMLHRLARKWRIKTPHGWRTHYETPCGEHYVGAKAVTECEFQAHASRCMHCWLRWKKGKSA